MPTFDRTTIVRGPAKITYDTAVFYSKGGVTLRMVNTTFDKDTDAFGMVSKAKTDFQIIVEFEPVGEVEELAKLYPYGSTAIGASIYGATDKALTITAADATYTINNAAITQLPSLRLSANNTAFGPVQFTGLLDIGGDPANLSDYYSVAGGAAFGTGFDPAKIVSAPYTATLGFGTPLSFMSEAGFEVSFDLGLNPVIVDGIGTVSMALQNLGATITCIPTGVAENAFNSGFESLSGGEDLASLTLDISSNTSGSVNLDFLAVNILDLEKRFSPVDNRLGTLTLAARRTFTLGVPNALFTISATA